jgi:NAD-dependent SIR2 family protein deacetylase
MENTLRRTRSFTNDSSSSFSVPEVPLRQQLSKRRSPPTSVIAPPPDQDDLSSSQSSTIVCAPRRSSLPTSSQTSTKSASSGRASLPNLKGKDLFDSMIWTDPLTTSIFYMFISSLRTKILQDVTDTTETHKFIRALSNGGRLVRNYTQNIDGLEKREGLSTQLEHGVGDRMRFSKTQKATSTEGVAGTDSNKTGVNVVQLHGALDFLRCGLCFRTTDWDEERHEETLSGNAPDCPYCTAQNEHREGKGRRSLAIGRLRPDIVLYGEEHPSAHLVGPLITHDLSLGPDVLLILGTSLRVHGLKVMVREFSKAVHGKGGKVIFVNQTKPPESVWGDVIDYHVQWDCDAWVEDLKERRPEVWLPQGMAADGGTKEEKPKAIAKNPSAMRPDTTNGAYLSWKINQVLGRFSGRTADVNNTSTSNTHVATVAKKAGSSTIPEGERKRKARPKAVRQDTENAAILVPKLLSSLKCLGETVTVAMELPKTPAELTSKFTETPRPQLPLSNVSTNLPSRRRIPSKKVRENLGQDYQLPTPPNSDQDATPPYTPRTKRAKKICGIAALLSSPTIEDTIRVNVFYDN